MKKILSAIIVFPLAACLVTAAILCLWMKLTPVNINNLPPLKNGDLVFQSLPAQQSVAITFATLSLYTHIGMIKIENDETFVVEAVGPVRQIPFKNWIRQGTGQRISIMRIKNLSAADATKALNAARNYYGKPYDFYFLPDDDAIYCSELVYKSFAQGSHINLGKEQAIADLNADNFAVKDLIKKRWRTYPPCKNINDFDSCYKIVMTQKLVSPASIAEDSNVEFIYSNYGWFK